VDGNGKYLLPGLWDMHVHAVFAERIDSMFPLFVANGVLGIRDMGTSAAFGGYQSTAPTDGKRFPVSFPGPGHVSADTKGYSWIPLPYSAAQ
jgi:hypothetical protein